VDTDNPDVHIVHRGKAKRISEQDRKLLKRRQAIEPIIGHLKAETGDRLHAVLCAAGYNIGWLLRMIARKGITFLQVVFLCLKQASAQGRSWLDSVMDRYPWVADVRSTLSTALANRLTLAASKLSQA
jgi:IS5 family transposase